MPSKLIVGALSLLVALSNGFPHPVEEFTPSAVARSPKPDLVKYQVAVPSTTGTAAPAKKTEMFQVYQPVAVPENADCKVLLMEHQFAWSYGLPFVGDYTPPKCKFNRVAMNFTVTSRGRQFDRLALMYLNDTEIWRTSTAEPTAAGIYWTYIKDVTPYLSLWNKPQKIIFDLGNIVDDTYTGIWNTTLTATFWNAPESADPASLIIPISARKGNTSEASLFMLPSQNATNTVTLPRNINRAVFSVSANGQAAEEFWWSNVLESDVNTFLPLDGTLYGLSPFREVQVYIDGTLAGVQFPFPVIFTGGITPGLWRPIVSIDAFDLREHEIDISPWLPILCDGKPHTFEIKVAGILNDKAGSGSLTKTVGNSWYVTGKIFVWQDSNPASVTRGTKPAVLLPKPSIKTSSKFTQDASGANETLEYTTDVSRSISITSLVTTQSGTRLASWNQLLSAKNYGLYTAFGGVQQNNQTTTGTDISAGGVYYTSQYSYPLYALSTYFVKPDGFFTLDGAVVLGNHLEVHGDGVFPTGLDGPSKLDTTLHGTGHYLSGPGGSTGYGSTGQEFSFKSLGLLGGEKEVYYRNVEAVNLTVVSDVVRVAAVPVRNYGWKGVLPLIASVFGKTSPKEAVGRGPGAPKVVLVQGGQ